MIFKKENLSFWSFLFISFILIYCFYNLSLFPKEKFKIPKNDLVKSNKLDFDKKGYFKDLSKRTENFPFISGDSFRIIADYVLDQVTTSIPETSFSKPKPIIFVKTDYLSKFFKEYFPKFSNKLILITHNSDYSITSKYKEYLDNDKLEVWFALNPEFHHSKLIPIPIGFINTHFNIEYLKQIYSYKEKTKPWNKRDIVLYVNFSPHTNKKVRQKYLNFFEKIKGTKIIEKRVDFKTYFNDLNNSKFVLCPRGNGLDTHRYYETVLMGAIPIVQTSTLDSIYNQSTSLILPSLENLNEKMLDNPDNFIKDMNFSRNIIFMEYWLKKIYHFRQNINY